ncbi:MAG: Lrp/AsnC ligand binding domain-containing protein [Bacteroidales bacterium]|nr:Lrp/AsnC ligand binding domain-containing protein [Bacteroidales bacterium]
MAKLKLDNIDRKILFFLVNDARKPYLEIARECGVSGAAIHQRMRKLEESGIITGSRLLIKPGAIGLNVCAFISIVVTESNKSPEVIAALKKIPEVVECHFVTGRYTLLVKVYCLDNDHLMDVIMHKLREVPYIQSTDTMISLEEVFERQVWVKDNVFKKEGRASSKKK